MLDEVQFAAFISKHLFQLIYSNFEFDTLFLLQYRLFVPKLFAGVVCVHTKVPFDAEPFS